MNTIITENKEWIDTVWEKIKKKLERTAVKSRYKIPYTTINGVHNNQAEKDITWWTNGFWGGMMWLMYEATGNEEYRRTAEYAECLLDDALRKYKELHHDVGFMWHLTSGANYRLTGNKDSCTRNLYAAASLFSRYNITGEYIRAWNGEMQAGYSIIDCLMNLSLLYWASDEIGDDRFKKIAMCHMEMAMYDHIRLDGSVNHIVDHEVNKKGVKRVLAGQGYSETSCWSRGLAWAVYGSVISYVHTEKKEYLEAAKKTANYFIDHCKESGYLPVIDFNAPKKPVYYDSTAGVCAACGMLEIAKHTSGEESARYAEEAIRILRACEQKFCNYEENEDALVIMGSERYPMEESDKKYVHMPIIYGDFFFVEAMCKLKGRDFFI